MRSFEISNPVITTLEINKELGELIDCPLVLNVKIKNFEQSSSSLPKNVNSNQICYEEIFTFKDIPN